MKTVGIKIASIKKIDAVIPGNRIFGNRFVRCSGQRRGGTKSVESE